MVEEYNEYDSTDGTTDSKFNMAVALLERVNILFYKLEEALCKKELERALSFLKTINNEVDCFFSSTEKKEIEEIEEKIDVVLNNINIDQTYLSYCGKFVFKKYPNERKEVNILLIELNRKIRKLMFKHKLLMPPSSDTALF